MEHSPADDGEGTTLEPDDLVVDLLVEAAIAVEDVEEGLFDTTGLAMDDVDEGLLEATEVVVDDVDEGLPDATGVVVDNVAGSLLVEVLGDFDDDVEAARDERIDEGGVVLLALPEVALALEQNPRGSSDPGPWTMGHPFGQER